MKLTIYSLTLLTASAAFGQINIGSIGSVSSVPISGCLGCPPPGNGQVIVNTDEYPMWTQNADSAESEPVAFSIQLQPNGAEEFKTGFTVPTGKRLVITRIAVDGFKPVMRRVHVSLLLTVGGQQVSYPLMYQKTPYSAGGGAILGLNKVKLYAESGTQVTGHIWLAPFDAVYSSYANLHVIGYLIDK